MAGETEWPDFNIPEPGAPAPVTPEGQPPAPDATPPASPDARAGAPAAGTPAAGTGEDEVIPKYRFDEQKGQLDQATQRVNQLTTLVRAIAGLEKEPAPPDPRKARIRQEILDVFPELKDALEIAQHKKALLETASNAQTESQQKAAEWDYYAKSTTGAIHDALAPIYLGKGKLGKDLEPELRQDLTDRFVRWVTIDPTRIYRYNRGDDRLRDEFVQTYLQRFVAPFRRESAAALVTSARSREKLPVGGGSGSPLGTPPPKPDSTDEDAVYKRAWEQTKQLLAEA